MLEKMRMESENYVYKKEIDWSTLMEGIHEMIFLDKMNMNCVNRVNCAKSC